jgi:ribosomal protein S14
MISVIASTWIKKDNVIRKDYKKFEIKKIVLKSLLYSEVYSFIFKLIFDFHFKKFKFTSSISRYRRYCMVLGNCRAVLQRFRLSRHCCKKYATLGFCSGLRKASF